MTNRRPDSIFRRVLVGLAAAALGLAGACTSNKPSLSGFGLGNSRTVAVGERFELRLPTSENGARLWRITSYDSYYVTLSGNSRAAANAADSEIVVPLLARHAGETVIEVTRRITAQDRLAGRVPQTKRFRIRITP